MNTITFIPLRICHTLTFKSLQFAGCLPHESRLYYSLSSHESPVTQWQSIRTSNRKVLSSTPDRSTRISFFQVYLCPSLNNTSLAVFILEDALSVWTNLDKHLLFVWLFVSSIKTVKGRIIRLDKKTVLRRSRRIMGDNSSRRIMRLVPVFILRDEQPDEQQMFAQVRPDG